VYALDLEVEKMNRSEIENVLRDVASLYPSETRSAQDRDVPRAAFNIHLALNGREPSGCSICDIGGDIGIFSTGCTLPEQNGAKVVSYPFF
jgi:hypothetical protein